MAYLRVYVVGKNNRKGLMLAIGLNVDAVGPYLRGFEDMVKVAAVNSPECVTLSGNMSAINDLATKFQSRKIFSRLLKTGNQAYHSHHMTSLGDEYEHLVNQSISEVANEIISLPPGNKTVFWQSSVNPKYQSPIRPEALYWRENMVSLLLFSHAVSPLANHSSLTCDVLIEIGPHPTLAGPLKQIFIKLDQRLLMLDLYTFLH